LYERLSTLDSFFLEIEDRTAHMHVARWRSSRAARRRTGTCSALIGARLDSAGLPASGSMTVPLKQGRPVWIDETQFDLEYHVRHTALPAPG